jgi:hypothetical protein
MSADEPTHVRVYIEASNTEMTVTSAYAKTVGLEPLKGKDALNKHGAIIPPKRLTDKAGKPTSRRKTEADQPAGDQAADNTETTKEV